MLRFNTHEDIIPCPPRGYPSWNSVPDSERGLLYEWEGRRAVADRAEQRARLCRVGAAIGWMAVGAVVGAAVAIAALML
jgi:hypothetical protein